MFHTTEKGTKLKIIDIKGKPYMQVADRLIWFREIHPDWSIETLPIVINDTHAIFKATALNEQGRVIATAHKKETPKTFPDYVEKAETSAIGRLLALCGFGTQFAEIELSEGDRIVDSPYMPATGGPAVSSQPVAQSQPQSNPEAGMYEVKFGKYKGLLMKNLKADEISSYIDYLHRASSSGKPMSLDAKEFIYRANLYFSQNKQEEDVPF